MTGAFDVITCLVVAIVLGVLGIWARDHIDDLVPGTLPSEEREHRANVLRRGATTSLVVAVIFAAAGVLLMLD